MTLENLLLIQPYEEVMKAKETALNLSKMGFTVERIEEAVKVSAKQVLQWLEGEAI